MLDACLMGTCCLLQVLFVLACDSCLLYLNFPPKLPEGKHFMPIGHHLPVAVNCLVSASTNQSPAFDKPDQSAGFIRGPKEEKMEKKEMMKSPLWEKGVDNTNSVL